MDPDMGGGGTGAGTSAEAQFGASLSSAIPGSVEAKYAPGVPRAVEARMTQDVDYGVRDGGRMPARDWARLAQIAQTITREARSAVVPGDPPSLFRAEAIVSESSDATAETQALRANVLRHIVKEKYSSTTYQSKYPKAMLRA